MKSLLSLSAATALAISALSVASAPQARAEALYLKYAINVSGADVMRMSFGGDVGKNAYNARVSIQPSGLMSFFIKKSFALSASGAIGKSGVRPRSFVMEIKKKKKLKTARVTWNSPSLTWTRSPRLDAATRASIRRAIGKGAPDPLALLVSLAGKDPAKACRGTRRVFDGHDVYDLRLSLGGTKKFSTSLYKGTAVLCRMRFVPVVMLSEKKRRQALSDPWLFNIWLAPVVTRDAGRLMVPVAAYGRMQGRKFTATLTRASIGGRKLSAR